MKKFVFGMMITVLLFAALSISSFAYENEDYYKGAEKG